jgi:predicted nucleic acid-binding Zn ribbon protein
MPLLSTRCPTCPTRIDYLSPKEPRPESCPTCGSALLDAVTAPGAGYVQGTQTPGGWAKPSGDREGFDTTYESPTLIVREKGAAPTLIDWTCACGQKHSDVYDQRPDAPPTCPACMNPMREVVGVPSLDWVTQRGAYFDRGLGCWITSKAQREREMQRLGVREYDESEHLAAETAQKIKDAAEDAEVRAMVQSMESGEDAAALKQARDQGKVADWGWAAKDLGVDSDG